MVRRNQKGQSIVEFALVLPILLLLLLGIVEFGLIFNTHVTLTHMAREWARYGSIHWNSESDTVLESKIIAEIDDSHLDSGNASVDVVIDEDSKRINVTINYNFKFFDPIIPAIIGENIGLTGSAVMSLE